MVFQNQNENVTIYIGVETNADAQLKKVGRQVERFTRDTDVKVRRATRVFSGFGTAITGVSRSLTGFVNRYTALLGTIGASLITTKAIADAQRFGITIAEISTIFDDTIVPLEAVEQRILSLSEALGLSEVVAAKGFYQIISSDITDAAAAMEVFGRSAELATAGLADIKETTDVVTSAIKAYGLGAEDAGRITDILFRTVEKGKTTIPELATSLGQVLPIASALGVPLEEVAAGIATITQGGIETNTAVIQLRQAFNQLLKPSATAGEVLARYNIDISQARIRTEGFRSVLIELQEKLGDQPKEYAKIFGNIRALIPVLALAGKQSEAFGRNLEIIAESGGAVEGALNKLFDSPFKRVQVFLNSLRIGLRSIGETFVRTLDEAIGGKDGATAVVNDLKTAMEIGRGFAKQLALALGDVVEQIREMVRRLDDFGGAAQILRTFGALVGSLVRNIVSMVTSLGTLIVESIVQLPRIVSAVVNEISRELSKIPGVDIEFTSNKDDIQDQINQITSGIIRARDELVRNGFDRADVQDLIGGEIDAEQFRKAYSLGSRNLFGALADEIAQSRAEVTRLFEEFEKAPASARQLNLEFEGLYSNADTRFKTVQKSVDDLLGLFDDLNEATSTSGQTGSGFEAFAAIAVSQIGLVVNEVARVQAAFDNLEFRPPALSALELADIEVATQIAAVEQALRDAGISLQIPIGIDDDASQITLQQELDAIRQQLGERFGISIPFTLDAENVENVFERAAEAAQVYESLSLQVNDSLEERVRLFRELEPFRAKALAEQLRGLGVAEETIEAYQNLRREGERAQVLSLAGFESVAQLFKDAAGDVLLPFEVQQELIAENIREIQEQIRVARDLGAVTDEQAQSLTDILGLNAQRQIQEAEILRLKEQQRLLDDPALQPFSNTEEIRRSLEFSIGEIARQVTGITEATTEGTEEFYRLRDAAQEVRDEVLGGADALRLGFLAALADIRRELGDTLRLGGQLARDIVGGIQGSVAQGLSQALQGESDAFDQFREALGRSLADSTARAISDALTAQTIDILSPILGGLLDVGPQTIGLEVAASALSGAAGELFAAGVAIQSAAAVPAAGAVEGAVSGVVETAPIAAQIGTELQLALSGPSATMTIASEALARAGAALGPASFSFQGSATIIAGAAKIIASAAADIAAAAVVAKAGRASGGFLAPGGQSAAPIQQFAAGGIPQRVQRISGGGIVRQRSLFEVSEAGQDELVVPLPGNRKVPVEVKGGGRPGQGPMNQVTVAPVINLNVVSDDRNFTARVLEQMPAIQRAIASSISQGTDRGLETAIRGASRGA